MDNDVLTKLARQCRECPLVKTCKHKKLETMEYLPDPIMADTKAQVLRETVSRVVNGEVVTIHIMSLLV